MGKLLSVTESQYKTILRQQMGDGVFIYKAGAERVGIIPMRVGPGGEILDDKGAPLVYVCEDGQERHYQVVTLPAAEAPGFIDPELATFLQVMGARCAFLQANGKRLELVPPTEWEVVRVGDGEVLYQGADLLEALQELEQDD